MPDLLNKIELGERHLLLVVRWPLLDVRAFTAPTLWDVAKYPSWDVDSFVRSFGPVVKREAGNITSWPRESVYCDADEIVRFPPELTRDLRSRFGLGSQADISRRLYSQSPLGHLVSFDFSIAQRFGFDTEATVASAVGAVAWWLERPLTIRTGRDHSQPTPLAKVGPAIGRCLSVATAAERTAPPAIYAGTPVAVVELPTEPAGLNQAWPERWERNDILEDVSLASTLLQAGSRLVPLCVILRFSDTRAARQTARELRVHLLRLHAERQGLRLMLDRFRRNEIGGPARSEPMQRLQDALKQSEDLLLGESFATLDNADVLRTAFAADQLFSGAEIQATLDGLHEIRPTLRNRLEQLLAQERRNEAVSILRELPDLAAQINFDQRTGDMSDHSTHIKIENSTIRNSVIGANNIVTDSIKSISERSDPEAAELKSLLEQILKLFPDVAAQLPPEDAELLADDISGLSKEATQEQPRKAFLKRAIDNIGKVANSVATNGPALLALALKIGALFGI